ncbi:DUF6402 family protein [Paracidovorax avenae]|uniref:DUF6402 family protein n=1 Tax=Paracidovorax avenae TaxID=80867 RepID=UPI000D205E88|nr:DUF6402 family protein [Paracidovorax avenae]AVT12691.1 hypothetical protein C8235_07220 [Paracidovorax avenae]
MNGIVHVDTERLRAQLEDRLPPKVRRFRLDDIPGVMRSRLGWPVAAALMERWFRGAAFEMPDTIKSGQRRLVDLNSAQLDEDTVTMQWALGFARVQAAMSRLQAQWNSPAGIEQLQRKVTRQMAGQTRPWRFGNLNHSAKVLDDHCQVNFLNVGQLSDPMDDFYGAMGKATLKIAVSGLVTPKGHGKATIAVDELALYLRDSYDFNDDSFLSQPLGFWGPGGAQRTPRSALAISLTEQWMHANAAEADRQSYLVQNQHFRQWRTLYGRGGDFMIVSDVHRARLPFPITLEW